MKHREAAERRHGAPPHRGGAAPVVALLEKRGRFLTATPFFASGRRMNVDRSNKARAGDLVLVAPDRPARRARADRGPDRAPGRRARRARGADARPRAAPAVRPAGRARGARRGRAPPGRRRRAARPARPADVHDRPADGQGLRRRDLRRAPRRRARARVGAHRRRGGARAARLGGRPRGLPARDERLRPRRGRADAARGAVEPRLLARAPPGPARRDGRAGLRGRARRPHARSTAR